MYFGKGTDHVERCRGPGYGESGDGRLVALWFVFAWGCREAYTECELQGMAESCVLVDPDMTDADSNKSRRVRLLRALTVSIWLFVVLGVWILLTYDSGGATYESSDRGFADSEILFKGRTLNVVEASFEKYRQWKRDANLRLYRTSKRSWTSPNLWLDNLTHRRWSVPYMDPSPRPAYNWARDYLDEHLSRADGE